MASSVTNKISDTQTWLAAFILQRPTSGIVSATEPAVTVANKVIQSILSAPFKWEWNRVYSQTAINVTRGNTDYTIALADFGYLEEAVLVNPDATGQTLPAVQLEVYKVLSREIEQNRPEGIATLLDDNNGKITFRLFPVPDKAYTVDLIYQKAPVVVSSLSSTWAPIPDKMAYLYEQGFMAHMQGIYNSQLYIAGMQMFFRQLVAASEGLTEMEKAIFLEDRLRAIKTQEAEVSAIQQGKGSRIS